MAESSDVETSEREIINNVYDAAPDPGHAQSTEVCSFPWRLFHAPILA